MLNKDPQISEIASETFKKEMPVIFEKTDGKYQDYFFLSYAKDVTFNKLKDI